MDLHCQTCSTCSLTKMIELVSEQQSKLLTFQVEGAHLLKAIIDPTPAYLQIKELEKEALEQALNMVYALQKLKGK